MATATGSCRRPESSRSRTNAARHAHLLHGRPSAHQPEHRPVPRRLPRTLGRRRARGRNDQPHRSHGLRRERQRHASQQGDEDHRALPPRRRRHRAIPGHVGRSAHLPGAVYGVVPADAARRRQAAAVRLPPREHRDFDGAVGGTPGGLPPGRGPRKGIKRPRRALQECGAGIGCDAGGRMRRCAGGLRAAAVGAAARRTPAKTRESAKVRPLGPDRRLSRGAAPAADRDVPRVAPARRRPPSRPSP